MWETARRTAARGGVATQHGHHTNTESGWWTATIRTRVSRGAVPPAFTLHKGQVVCAEHMLSRQHPQHSALAHAYLHSGISEAALRRAWRAMVPGSRLRRQPPSARCRTDRASGTRDSQASLGCQGLPALNFADYKSSQGRYRSLDKWKRRDASHTQPTIFTRMPVCQPF